MQLYHLLSIYTILKPPIHGNCTVEQDSEKQKKIRITLEDFKKAFPSTGETYKEVHLKNLKNKFDEYIEAADWDDSDEIFDLLEEFKGTLDQQTKLKNCIQYYLTGFVCHKFFKKEKCEQCKAAFHSSHENLIRGMEESDFLLIKTQGGLTHPNIRLYNLFGRIESYFTEFVDSTTVYFDVVDKLIDDGIIMTFPCMDHAKEKLPELIHYYIQLRMLQTAKLLNRESKKESAEIKKSSRFKTN